MRTMAWTLLLFVAFAAAAPADTLRLRNGQSLQGTLLGANTREVQFIGSDGTPRSYSISSITAIQFGSPAPAAPPPRPARPPAAPPPSVARVTIPAGTRIAVRMINSIDSKTTGPGERFRCSIDDPIVVGNSVVVQRGADCTVQIIEVQENKELALKLYDITVGGRAYDVVSNYAQVEATGKSKGRKATRRAVGLGALGAGIGALAGGGKGAAIGAASGAGLGAISGAAAKGKTLNIPSETRLQFELRAPLPLG